jgi:hypothetical protein
MVQKQTWIAVDKNVCYKDWDATMGRHVFLIRIVAALGVRIRHALVISSLVFLFVLLLS